MLKSVNFGKTPLFLRPIFLGAALTLTLSLTSCGGGTPDATLQILAGSMEAAGNLDGTGTSARFRRPIGVAVDIRGNVYVADSANNVVRKINAAGVVTTLAGAGGLSGSLDGAGAAARFNFPTDLALDVNGSLYVTDQGNHVIRKITPAGVVSTLAGAVGSCGNTDGTSAVAQFCYPTGVAVDPGGVVYVTDSANNVVRKINTAGAVSTLAGTAGSTGNADGVGNAARFNNPAGVAVDASGNLYVADSMSSTIRKITATGIVSTLAGAAGSPGSADGVGASARFDHPTGLAVDNGGNVYVADSGNNAIRRITPSGVVSTYRISGTVAGAQIDGAVLRSPLGIGVAGSDLVITSNNAVLMLKP